MEQKIREIIRNYDMNTPIEKMKEKKIYQSGNLTIPQKIISEHMGAGYMDTICIFFLEDGSILLMEKGLAQERLKDEYGQILE
ncbi:hypothetical protein KQI68_07030 [Peptoniphilus sp. MSJ-1]|uniref:Uncharacterized protein n=1 Tax=Peptoniphilus ovalis TaxID=2841503 RepID=A0ABS6FHE5_9FIRM|nr:hypothetical protein [Peptoniphilus ovalis]MBU5669591.1 hypothetical protein [Peptoniphilus ovalis]